MSFLHIACRALQPYSRLWLYLYSMPEEQGGAGSRWVEATPALLQHPTLHLCGPVLPTANFQAVPLPVLLHVSLQGEG